MILLDTNVLSAVMLRTPDPAAVSWLDKQPAESVWTTSITVFELRNGIELLPRGQRRTRLQELFTELLADDLAGRVQFFDTPAALAAGGIAAARQKAGRSAEIRDVQIAGIATARRATLATRNTRHFAGIGIDLVDPWGNDIK